MAHGYLSYQPVTGESPLADKLFNKIKDVVKKEGEKNAKKVLKGMKDLLKKDKDTSYRNKIGKRYDVVGGGKKDKPGGGMLSDGVEPKGLLGAGKGGLVKRDDKVSVVGKNATNVDKKEQAALPPAGGSGRVRKGGGVVNMGGAVSKGLNADSFLNTSLSGVKPDGTYASPDERKVMFKKSVEMRSAESPSSDITGGSGDEIVAAIKQNTAAVSTLVDTTEQQIQSDVNIAQQSIQAQETMFSRRAAKREEKALEEGEDLSSFVTPEKIMKAVKPKGKGGGGGKDGDKKGGGFPGMGMVKGLLGKGKIAGLGKGAAIAAAAAVALLGGISLGTHLRHQYLDAEEAKRPKRDRLGNLVDDDGNIISESSSEQFTTVAGERYDPEAPTEMQQKAIDLQNQIDAGSNAPIVPGFNQGGLVTGGKANLVDDVPIRADEGEVVMSNRAGNMFGRGTLMGMNALAGSTNTPSGGGYAEGGLVGMSSKTRKMYRAFGQGIIDAQLDARKELAEIQGEGLKNYFENKGGFEKLGEGLKGFFEGLGNFFNNLNPFNRSPGPGPGGPAGPGGPVAAGDLKTAIRQLESGNDYSSMFARDRGDFSRGNEDITKMTIDQVHDLQTDYLNHQASKGYGADQRSAAMGAYQMMEVKKVAQMLGIDTSTTKFDQATQDRMSEYYLNVAGYQDWKAGKITDEEFNNRLAGQFASVKTTSGGGVYDNDGMNNAYGNLMPIIQQTRQGLSSQSGAQLPVYASQADVPSNVSSYRNSSTGKSYQRNADRSGFTELPDPEPARGGQDSRIISANHPDTGAGYTVEGLKDGQGRPAVFSRGGASAFARMMKDSKGIVKGSDITSSKRSRAKNNSLPGASATSNHLTGNAMDIHGASKNWIISNGARYGWHINDYPGSHGGHFDFRGAGQSDLASTSTGATSGGSAPAAAPAAPASTQTAAIPASSATPNSGTPLMATSAQVAMAGSAPAAAPTIINNYYGSGGNQDGTPVPNGVSPGIGMDRTGTEMFQDLRIRSLA